MSCLNAIMGTVEICHLYISPGHNFVGHHGREPGTHPMIEVPTIECVAGRGIRGLRVGAPPAYLAGVSSSGSPA